MNPNVERMSAAGPPDDELITRSQRGDQRAFAEIVRRYQRSVYRVAYALTRNASDADDLAQETFLRAWGAIGRFELGSPLYPWLARICTNQAFSLFRTRKRRPETPIEPLLEAGKQWGVDDDPADHTARNERDSALQDCFAQLPPEQQAVLALRVMQDMSYDEIAKTLNVPIGTVMSRLSRARVELKKLMQQRSGDAT
ncbi:MAG: sigma-70 family RNA polymerase sigma factor [Candidatus Eisenbacteria bacterium]|nr:sigma-70 family RNA polymerase sigma factor [Candidatus Eisenbacteria bacterium]